MKNYIGRGDNLTVVAPADVTSDGIFFAGGIIGIYSHDAKSGTNVAIVTEGVFANQPKDTAAAWVFGDQLYWDNTAKKFTKTATNNKLVGVAVAAAAQADTVGTVKLEVSAV